MGCHKTASTSIQKFCFDNRKMLEQNNIGYMPSNRSGRHLELNQCVLRRDIAIYTHPHLLQNQADLINKQRKSICNFIENSKSENFIFSDEGLDFIRTKAELDRLKTLFPSYCELIPIIVLREDSDWKASWINYLKNYPDINHECYTNPLSPYYLSEDSWYFDIGNLLSLLDDNFQRVVKLNYGKQMVSKFLTQFNIDVKEEYLLNRTSYVGKSIGKTEIVEDLEALNIMRKAYTRKKGIRYYALQFVTIFVSKETLKKLLKNFK